ncbi:MAG: kynureninase, partial [Sphingomonadales bacterium]
MNRIEPKAQKASVVIGLDDCRKLDASDPMAGLSDRFLRGDAGVIYLDANSLGPTPSAAPARVSDLIEGRWAGGRSQSWGAAGWVDAPERLGAKLARLIGAKPEEVIVGDGTSVNLFKLLVAALELRAER